MVSDKISLAFYQQIKQNWGKEDYVEFCLGNERNLLVWINAGA
jgi:hypothetical protein